MPLVDGDVKCVVEARAEMDQQRQAGEGEGADVLHRVLAQGVGELVFKDPIDLLPALLPVGGTARLLAGHMAY